MPNIQRRNNFLDDRHQVCIAQTLVKTLFDFHLVSVIELLESAIDPPSICQTLFQVLVCAAVAQVALFLS